MSKKLDKLEDAIRKLDVQLEIMLPYSYVGGNPPTKTRIRAYNAAVGRVIVEFYNAQQKKKNKKGKKNG